MGEEREEGAVVGKAASRKEEERTAWCGWEKMAQDREPDSQISIVSLTLSRFSTTLVKTGAARRVGDEILSSVGQHRWGQK